MKRAAVVDRVTTEIGKSDATKYWREVLKYRRVNGGWQRWLRCKAGVGWSRFPRCYRPLPCQEYEHP